jgi:hypothetical protein
MSWISLNSITFFINYFFNYIVKIYDHKIEYQPKNYNLFETIITIWKANKNKSCSLFPSHSIIEGYNREKI